MGIHNPLRCHICLVEAASRDAPAPKLAKHFRKHGFHPTPAVQTPGEWVWKWMIADAEMWVSSMTHRAHIEKRIRQIEQLAAVDDFTTNEEARLWLDLALRAWKEGLPRSVEFKIRANWELGDEMPSAEEMVLIARRLREVDNAEVSAGVIAALQDRFCYAAPGPRDLLVQLLCVSWGLLPAPGKKTGFLDTSNDRMSHISAIWQCNAQRMLHDRIASFSPDQRRPLLGWAAAALLPGVFRSRSHSEPSIYGVLADEDVWPQDPRLPWLAQAWSVHPGRVASRLSHVVLQGQSEIVPASSEGTPRRL